MAVELKLARKPLLRILDWFMGLQVRLSIIEISPRLFGKEMQGGGGILFLLPASVSAETCTQDS